MFAADGDVAFVTANHHLFTGMHRLPALIKSQHHIRLAPAVANGFQLHQLVCPGQQILTANKQFPQEVGTQTVTQHRNIQLIDNIAQLLDLLFRQELAFIKQNAVHRLLLMFLRNHRKKHRVIIIQLCLGRQADPRAHLTHAKTVIYFGGKHQRTHTTFLIII
ncbi:hypothetical protein D3C80_1034130 [compost metagenome]